MFISTIFPDQNKDFKSAYPASWDSFLIQKNLFKDFIQINITDQANVKAVPPNPIVHNAKWDLRSDRFDL